MPLNATRRYATRANLEIAKLDVAHNDLLPSVDLDLVFGFNGNDGTRRSPLQGIVKPHVARYAFSKAVRYSAAE